MRAVRDPEARREDILTAALRLFRETGFEKVSVESIAKEAGIAKGSFYNYFKTKEDVYEAVIAGIAAQNIAVTRQMLSDKNVCPKERLVMYLDWTFQLAEQQDRSLSRVFEKGTNSSPRQLYLRALDEGSMQLIPDFESLLAEGAAGGIFRLIDARFTAVAMLGAFRGIHVAYYNNLQIDMATGKEYLYAFLSRLLDTGF